MQLATCTGAHRPSTHEPSACEPKGFRCAGQLSLAGGSHTTVYVHHRRWQTLSKAEKSRFERAAPSQSPTAPAPSFEYHPANGIQPQNLLPATPAPATVFWFGYHSSPEAIYWAPSPTAAVAVPARTLAPTAYGWCGRMDATRTAAPALPVAPLVPVATASAPPAPPKPLKQVALKLAAPAQPTTAAPLSACSAHHTLESTGLERLSTVAAVALESMIASGKTADHE